MDRPISTDWDSLAYFLKVMEHELDKGDAADISVIDEYTGKYRTLSGRVDFWGCPTWKIKEEFAENWAKVQRRIELHAELHITPKYAAIEVMEIHKEQQLSLAL